MQEHKGISRRKFIVQSCLLISASMVTPSGFALSGSRKYKMGLQLFTIRDAMEKDSLGSLKQVRSLGYEDLEIFGYDGDTGKYYGFKATEFKKVLDDHDLTTSSGHYNLPAYFDKPEADLMRYVDQCIEGAHILDQDFITWPWLDPKFRTMENYKILAGKLNLIGERVNKSGLGFAYHNHDFEFLDHHGENGYDLILKETDPALVKLQLDLYWVMHSSKLSPAELINKQPERFVMWHIKDMDKITRDYTELGSGSIDYISMLPGLPLSGLQYYYIEQGSNFAVNSMQSIEDSAVYFKKHLKKFL
ncbi:sugar phosphate isomerase/epimerase [uncultured Eudoraea sp.]|uniref:sugar phosphate isomerase/epimerase family protein n=1 Tax=uncultured Eudoraea sp. TaxID=1035614 RepID=UPI0026147D5F|nr:sugar phosphate isomerase/epimerase [uncultured Eudoraea sp.]